MNLALGVQNFIINPNPYNYQTTWPNAFMFGKKKYILTKNSNIMSDMGAGFQFSFLIYRLPLESNFL